VVILICLSVLPAQGVKIPTGAQHTGSSLADLAQSESVDFSFLGTGQSERADADHRLGRKPWSVEHQDSVATITAFQAGVQECIRKHKFRTDWPIVVTSVDSKYNDITKKWAERNEDMGVSQYFLIALDSGVAEMAALLGYPALSPDGKCVSGHPSHRMPAPEPGPLPGLLSATKFIVPALLIGEGFQRVVFSEMDVFFRVNPFKATDLYEGRFLAMASPSDPDIVNIGFMEFRAPEGQNEMRNEFLGKLTSLSITIMERKDTMRVIGADQDVFNKFIRYYKMYAGTLFYPTLLNTRSPEFFAVHPEADTEITKIAHFTNCVPNPECKIDKLNKLYAQQFKR